MLSLLIFVLMLTGAFLTALLAASFYWAWLEVQARRSGTPGLALGGVGDAAGEVLKGSDLSTIRLWGALLERVGHVDELRRQIDEANLSWTVGRLTLMMLLAGTASAALLWQIGVVPALPAAGLVLLAAGAPLLYMRAVRARRFQKFAEQFPEALDSLTRAMKAGYPLAAAIELLAMEQPEPLAAEMRRTREEWNLGVGWDQALDHLAERVPLAEVAMFVSAVKLQNRVGGRLNDVLARLGETMRDTAAIEGEVRAVSAHSRVTGLVLTVLPLVIGGLMFVMSPEYMAVMLRREEGRMMLGVVAVANVAAHFVIRRVARVRV
jgi:tight adherence protein B